MIWELQAGCSNDVIRILWWSQWCTHSCVFWHCHWGEPLCVCVRVCARACVRACVERGDKLWWRWKFRLLSVQVQWSDFTGCPPRQEVQKSNAFLMSKYCPCFFLCWQLSIEFILPWGCFMAPFHQLSFGFQFHVVNPAWVFQGFCLFLLWVLTDAHKEARKASTTYLLHQ
jgi:hypothetical protein